MSYTYEYFTTASSTNNVKLIELSRNTVRKLNGDIKKKRFSSLYWGKVEFVEAIDKAREKITERISQFEEEIEADEENFFLVDFIDVFLGYDLLLSQIEAVFENFMEDWPLHDEYQEFRVPRMLGHILRKTLDSLDRWP